MPVPFMNIINKCFIDGMPDDMKVAIITPILKKASLDSETLKSYRHISNMSFLSKLLERIISDRLIAHMREKISTCRYNKHTGRTALPKQHYYIRA